MLPRKKLEFYGNRYGIDHFASVKMTAEDLVSVCDAVGSRQFTLSDCGGKLSNLIDCVSEDPQFRQKVVDALAAKGFTASEDILAIRLPDYAADDVMRAYAALHPAKD